MIKYILFKYYNMFIMFKFINRVVNWQIIYNKVYITSKYLKIHLKNISNNIKFIIILLILLFK